MPTEAQILKSLNLGSSKAALEGEPNSPLAQLLELFALEISEDLKVSLDSYGAVTTSAGLRNSIAPSSISVKGSEVSIGVQADFYWKFVNYGVNGSLINRGAPNWGKQNRGGWKEFEREIDGWIKKRGIFKPDSFGSYKSFNYAIRKSISEKGKAPRPFFSDVVNDTLIRELEEPITELMKRAITIRIVEPWK